MALPEVMLTALPSCVRESSAPRLPAATSEHTDMHCWLARDWMGPGPGTRLSHCWLGDTGSLQLYSSTRISVSSRSKHCCAVTTAHAIGANLGCGVHNVAVGRVVGEELRCIARLARLELLLQ